MFGVFLSRKFVILTGTHFVKQNWQYINNSSRYTQKYKDMCFKHMELLEGEIFIILVKRWQLRDYLPNLYPKLSQTTAREHQTQIQIFLFNLIVHNIEEAHTI